MNFKNILISILIFVLSSVIFGMPSDMPFFAREVIWHIKANIEDNIASDSNRYPEADYPQNINKKEAIPGAIAAAPFEKEEEGKLSNSKEYCYVWQRIAGITMMAFLEELKIALNSDDKDAVNKYLSFFVEYIKFYDFASKQENYYPGIAKFYLSGQSVMAWQNPQNDGTAFTALVLTEFADILLSQRPPLKYSDEILDKQFVEQHLFDSKGNGLIHKNLSYIVDNLREKTYDLWESCFGEMFFTTMIQIKALTAGAALSANFNNLSLATKYISSAEILSTQALDYYQTFTYGREKFKTYCEMLNLPANLPFPVYPKYKSNNFSRYRGMSINSSILFGALYGNLYEYGQPSSWVYKNLTKDKLISGKFNAIIKRSGEKLSPTSLEVLRTVRFLADKSFSINGLDPYKINYNLSKGISLIGRYPGDIYNGVTWDDPLNKGNAHFPASLALAQYYYTLAYELKKPEYIQMGHKQMQEIFKYVTDKESEKGKAFIMSEQIDRNTGEQTSANNYTWSYAQYLLTHQAFLKAHGM